MTGPRPLARTMSPEEYLAFEARAPRKHEYVDGFVYAMSGTTMRHGKIVSNVVRHLLLAAGDGPCEVYIAELKVRADETKYYYPDVSVTCAPRDDDALVIADPCLIVEVTSPSTRATDRREKMAAYRRIPTLRAYVIVETGRPQVERHWREAGGTWRYEIISPESGGRVPVPCPAAELTLDAIYAGVTLRTGPRRVKEGAGA